MRARTLVSLLAAMSGLVVGWPVAQAADAAPALWEGEIRTADGQPAHGAEVVAYARPPATQLQPGARLAPVARTTTDPSGHFTLRAEPTGVMRTVADEAGWATIMVTAHSREGMTLAIDSVAWKPEAGYSARSVGVAPGRWVTSPADLFATDRGYRTASAADEDPGAASEEERPSVLVLSPRGRDRNFSAKGVTDGCGLSDSKDLGVKPVAVGELFLERAWGGTFNYTNTKTTSFQIGVSESGKDWRVGGSVSMTKQSTVQSLGKVNAAGGLQRLRWRADMIYKRFQWFCGDDTYNYFMYTLEPTEWTGGMRQEDPFAMASCNRKFLSPVPPNRALRRDNGSSITLGGAIDVAGFNGSMTSTISASVTYIWDNEAGHQRDVCGSTNYVSKNTRALTLP
jgi:hypothetical protein